MSVSRKPGFERLVSDYGGEIYAYLYRMLGLPADAEDVLQEAFLKAFVAYDRLDADANFRAWLYKIAGNTAKTSLRHQSRSLELEELDLSAGGPSVETQAEQRIWRQRVRLEVDQLPFKQRASLLLRNYQGLSYAMISEALEITPEAARANVYQALKKLKERFAAELAEREPTASRVAE